MDKLQPFIKYHFWLLFVPAFVMPPLAWWMTTSDLQATITERTDALDQSYSSISDGINKPNDDWIAKAEDLIRIRKETNTRTVERLWEWQKSLVKWPPSVSQAMNACPYRGEITDNAIARRVPIDYRRNYSREVRRVWLLSEPIGHETDPIPPNAPRKVWFPLSQMPQVPASKWQNLPPSFIEIWNSQEDLWLLEQLMLAVKRTNANSNTISDSFVREIREVGLFGGTRVQPNEVSAEAAAATSNPMLSGAPPTFGGARKAGRRIPTSSKFNLEQEFKVKGLTAVTGRRNSSSLSSMNEGMVIPGSEGSSSTASAAEDLNVDENRYVTVKDAYRTRGFHLVVTIHQQYVPELIRELLDSQYPIDVIRMEQVARNPDEPDGSTGSQPGGPESGGPTNFGPVAGVPGSGGGVFDTGEEEPEIPADYPGGEGLEGEGTGDAFDETGEGESSAAPITNSAVKLALSELDLVEFSIVGEMYLYNPPKPAEGEEAAPVEGTTTTPPATPETPETTEPGTPTATTPETGTTEPAVPETGNPATPAPGTPGTPAPATPKPATPAPATPEGGTPAPATPKPATPAPATPVPETQEAGTPAPAKPEPETPASESEDGT